MLINLRNALMAGKRLPYDAEVEYLESSGTQYIDTGVKVYDDTNVEITVKVNTQSEVAFIGSATSTDRFVIRSYSGSLSYGFGSWWTNTAATLYNQWRTLRTDVSVPTVYCDGTSYPTTNTSSAKSGTDSILIFDSFRANRGDVAVAGVKIWRGSTLVFDAIPVRKGTVGYLYDRVSGKLFGNAGSGDFILGQDVVPVEYIESHGTEYINTGIVPNDSTGIRISYSPTTLTSTNNVFGVYSSASNRAFRLTCSTATASTATCNFWWGPSFSASGQSPWYGRKTEFSLNFVNSRKAAVDGITVHDIEDELTAIGHPLALLSNRVPSSYQSPASGRLYGCDISKGAETAMSLIPIRVGTEGALINTLTRRVYRNAGTGAFTYGNDLKYPIPSE